MCCAHAQRFRVTDEKICAEHFTVYPKQRIWSKYVLLTVLPDIGDIQYTYGSCQVHSWFVSFAEITRYSLSHFAHDEDLRIEDFVNNRHGWVDSILQEEDAWRMLLRDQNTEKRSV
jgi:hypothetical protein